jgi:Nucleotide-diphospho-sugar transferase
MPQQVCFVLTSDGRDVHADMTLISVQFARRANRDVSIIVLTDDETEECLSRQRHALLNQIDRLIPVSSPPGSAGFRNRYVKTQMRRHLTGPFLYLDADTLVLRRLDAIFSCGAVVAGVSNHNGPTNPCHIYKDEKAVFQQLSWPIPSDYYVNGGVLYLADAKESYAFCETWHAKWQLASRATGMHFDQPSLNSALHERHLNFSLLDHRYNAQVNINPRYAPEATVWHIYHSDLDPSPKNVLETCLRAVRKTGAVPDALIDSIRQRSHPWNITNPIDFIAVRRILRRERLLGRNSLHRLWLAREVEGLFKCAFSRAFGAMMRLGVRSAKPGKPFASVEQK